MKPNTVIATVAMLVMIATQALADAPMLLNYQGRLTDPSGSPKNGTFSVQFCVYDALSGGNQVPPGTPWCETQSVLVTNGVFNVLLGSVTALPVDLFTGGPSDASGPLRFLQVAVDGETLTPRQRIVSAAYAINAKDDGDWTTADWGSGDVLFPSKLGTSVALGSRDSNNPMPTRISVLTSDIAFEAAIRKPTSPPNVAQAFHADLMKDTLNQGDVNQIALGFFANNDIGPPGGTDFRFYAAIQAVAENPNWSTHSAGIRFLTGDARTGSEAMRISGSGRIGIGTSTPRTTVDVANGDLYTSTAGNGVILKSPDGATCRRLGIDNAGSMTVTPIACP